jgi:integrase
MANSENSARRNSPVVWNKDRIIGPKPPLKLMEILAIRIRLQLLGKVRDLAMFNMALDSKLRGSDLVRLSFDDVATGFEVKSRAVIIQKKTMRPVQFEITETTRHSVKVWISAAKLMTGNLLFPSQARPGFGISTRQYSRLLNYWVTLIGLNSAAYGTHSLRRTKASLIYKRTGNIRAIQILLGHSKLESTVRYLGIEVDDALMISEQTEM